MVCNRLKWHPFISKVAVLLLLIYGIVNISKYKPTIVSEYLNTMPLNSFYERNMSKVSVSLDNSNKNSHWTSDKLPLAITYDGNHWSESEVCRSNQSYTPNSLFNLADFVSDAGKTKIFTHTKKDHISVMIMKTGAFEPKTINRMLFELRKSPDINLIDIGTNVGQHCIAAALIGRHVIAIDASASNVEHVCASALYSRLEENITLIHNVITDSHGQHPVRYGSHDDFAMIHVDEDDMSKVIHSKFKDAKFEQKTKKQHSCLLNDLLDLPNINKFKNVFIKMDVEGHEHKVLLGGSKFFARVNVRGIIMEWAWHKNRPTANVIISFMKERNFKPYNMNRQSQTVLPSQNSHAWPQDVLWLPI